VGLPGDKNQGGDGGAEESGEVPAMELPGGRDGEGCIMIRRN
jgi:hypothetical protein